MVSRTRKSGRNRTRKTSAWSRRLSRFTSRFPRLLRTDYWSKSRTGELWNSLFGAKKKPGTRRLKKTSDELNAPTRRNRRYRKPSNLRMENLEARQLLTAVPFNGTAYTQDFSLLSGSAVAAATVANTTMLEISTQTGGTGITGWYMYGESGTNRWGINAGGSNTGSVYGMLDGSGGKALGSLGSGGAVSQWGLVLKNTSGSTIASASISYDAVINRNPSTTANAYPLSYMESSTDVLGISGTGAGTFSTTSNSWTSTALGFTTPSTGTGSPGGQAAITPMFKIATQSGTLTNLNWEPNEYLYIRWTELDEGGADSTAGVDNFSISVANYAATITGTSSGAVQEDGTLVASGDLDVSDADAGQNGFQAVAPAALVGTYGSFTFDEITGGWSYTLNNSAAVVQALKAGQNVADNLTVTSTDGSATQVISVTVTGTNDLAGPTGTDTGAVQEDGTLTASGDLDVIDVDAGEDKFQPVLAAALVGTYGTFTFDENTGGWSYTLNNSAAVVQALAGGQLVADSLTVTSLDGTANETIDITVTGTNDPATLGNANVTLTEGDTVADLSTSGTLSISDIDSPNTFVPQAGTVGSYGTFTIDASGNWTYTSSSAHDEFAGGSVQQELFSVLSSDGTPTLVKLTLNGTNDSASIGGTVTSSVAEDGTLTAGGTATVTDIDNPQNFQSVPPAALNGTYGTFTFNESSGAWTYALTNAAAAVQALKNAQVVHDLLAIVSSDGTATSNIDISITGANDTPLITGDTTGSVTEEGPLSDAGDLDADDVDTGESSFQANAGSTTYGSFTLLANGNWSYSLDNGNPAVQALNTASAPLSDSFNALSVDGTTVTVNITINGLDENPTVVTIDAGSGNNTLTIDFDAGTYTVTGGSPQPLSGLVTLNFNGQGGTDTIVINGGGGSQVFTYGPAGVDGNTGSFTINGLTVNYTGLEPISNTGTPTDLEYILPVASDNATLKSLGGGMYELSGPGFETTTFNVSGLNSLTIRGDGGSDAITIDDAISVPTITLDFETITLKANLTGTLVGALNTSTVNVEGTAEIQDAVTLVAVNGTINVAAGTYNQDVALNKNGLKLLGAGAGTTTLSGAIGGIGATIAAQGSDLEIAGFTITRDGNAFATWNDPNLNTVGIAIQGLALSGIVIHDNSFVGNRTGIDVNNSGGHTIRNNKINDNRTGLIFRNQTDGMTVTENEIKDNWTVGIVFLDASGGTNSPVQTAANGNFSNNAISGNWYGGIVDRQSGGLLPAPGANLKNFSGNWFGTASPVVTTANSAEPGYAAQIPVIYGGTATNPGGAPDIAGPASLNFDISPFLTSGTDTSATFGFQGDFSTVAVTAAGSQTGATGKIQEGINTVTAAGTVKILAGAYSGDVNATSKSVTLSPGASPAQVTINGNLTLNGDDTLAIEITGTNAATDYDNLIVNGTVALGSATLTLSGAYVPVAGNSFTIIDNDGTSDGNGVFNSRPEGSVTIFNGKPLTLSYVGGDNNNVTLSIAQPTSVYVNDTWLEQSNTSGGTPGVVEPGDTVMSNTGAGDTAVSGLVFSYDAFATIPAALAAVANAGTVHVLAGSYLQISGSVALTIAQNVTIDGQGDGVVTVNANGSFTGIEVPAGAFTVNIDGITLTNFTSTGIHAVGNLNLADSTVSGGFVGIWADGPSSVVDISNTIVSGSLIFGVQVSSGADADITGSEIIGVGSTSASVIVSGGQADILNSKLTGSNRGLLVNATGNASIHNSNLTGNSVRAIDNASANIVDASSNWFGTNSEAGVQAQTLGLVDFTPYLDIGTDFDGLLNDGSARGFEGDLSYLHVTALGQQTGGGRVSEGVTVVADGLLTGANRIVDVHAGTYIDNVTISNKSLQLRGANFGVDPTDGGVRGLESIIDAGGSGDVVAVLSSDAVKIDGLTLRNGGTGVYVEASDNVQLRNNIITDVTYGALYDSAGDGVNTGGVVANNLIQALSGAQTFGVLAFNSSYVSSTNNDMTGVDVGIFEQYMYQPNGLSNANNVISGNEITAAVLGYGMNERGGAAATTALSGNDYIITGPGGVGVQLQNIFKTNGVTLTGEDISGAEIGVYFFTSQVSGQTGSALITGGTITGTGAGSTGILATNNLDGFGPALEDGELTISGVTISGVGIGVHVEDDVVGGSTFNVHATITDDTNISTGGTGTGILVSGSDASADIIGNDNSIQGNSIGIDVNGGTATISGNHIYNNTLYGIRFTGGGQGNVDDNNFEGDASPDNGTDLRLDATAGGIIGGTLTGNTFAGATYIDQRDSQDLTALRVGSLNPLDNNIYKRDNATIETNNFNIEARVFHKLDSAASGLVTWVANTIFVTPATSPTPTDNDYTRIKNAIEGVSNGWTIDLQGTFNWTEANAAASWALGNDGVVSAADDYSIIVPANLNNVTFTASGGLGSATIQGPGDLAGVNLEGVLIFDGGDNKGWTISNLQIQDFDLSIAFFSGAGGADAFDGTTITNNYIRVPVDLNASAAPIDNLQNIGIHYAVGKNQTISNNVIEIMGGGLSNGTNFSSSVGMQSNTSGGDLYDGLLIDNNTINVTGVLAVQPSNVLGIWENGHAHTSDITVSNNDFFNLTGNNQATNLMRAFRVTSHSTGGVTPTTVTYSGNTVDGANIGFQWIAGSNFAGQAAVEVIGNTLTDVGTGFLIQSNGVAHLSDNSLTNVGGTGVGVDVVAGSVVTINDSTDDNDISGFATGIRSAGSLTVTGNNTSITGNTTGIGLTGGTATIIGNTITGNTTGIDANGATALIQGNNLTSNVVGIRVQGDALVDAGDVDGANVTGLGTGGGLNGSSSGNNNLIGYSGALGNYAIEDLNLDASLNRDVQAENNSFGSVIPAVIEQVVFHTNDNPIYTRVFFTPALAPNHTPFPPNVVFVDDSWTGTAIDADADGPAGGSLGNGVAFGYDQFATIQDAIDAVAIGGTIYVYDGLYVEALTVGKALSLLGIKNGQDARTRSVTGEAVIQAPGSGDALIEVNADNVTIDGFTIDGDDAMYRDIRVNGVNDAHVTNNIITGAVRGVQYNGAAGGNSGGLVQFNKIQNLTVTLDGSYGVLAFDASYASVKDNTMSGLDVGIFEQYFYQPNAGNAPNVISGNVITAALLGYGTNERAANASVTALSGNTYHIGSGGVGVQLYNIYKAGGITLNNETIDGAASVGIYAFISGGSVSVTGGSITSTAGSIGVHATNYLTDFVYAATGDGDITLDSVDISNFAVGVKVEDDPLGAFNIHATITNDTDISGATTAGILVTGPQASADITNNDNSIHNNAIGIQIVGGSAVVTNNDIHHNGQGVVIAGGTGTLTNNHIHENGVGISVSGASTLNLSGGLIDDNTSNGLVVVGDGTVKQTVIVNGTTFSSNSTGQPLSAGHGDITLFGFAGPVGNPSVASFTNVVVNSDLPDYAIQVRGLNGDIANDGLALNPGKTANVTFNNVDINGTQQRFAMLVQQYADLSTFSFTDVEFNSVALGGLVIFDAAGSLNLGNSVFHDTYTLNDGPGNGTGWDIVTSLTNINATNVTFLNSSNVALDKTNLQDNFAIEDRVAHSIDATAPAGTALIDWVGSGPFDNSVFVTTESYIPPLTTVASVQRGINVASPGWSVYVNSGTYTEQLDIAKNLKLEGVGNTTIIKAPATFAPANNFTFAGITRESVIAVRGANNVTIKNLKVDGDGRGNSVVPGNDFFGIGIYNSNATVDTVTVTGVRDSSLSGVQRGRAIFAGNDSGTHTVNVTGSTIGDYQKNGVDMRGAGLTANVTGNIITGSGSTGLIAQNGVVFLGGAAGTISGNTIKSHEYTGPDVSTGVLLFNTGATSVTGNTLGGVGVGNEVGIYNLTTTALISGNNISGSSVAGIDVDGGTALVQNNVLNGNAIGLLIESGAIVDAGQTSPTATNFTGVAGGLGPNGSSAGGNDFSGYTATATATSGAIVNLNADVVTGRQGAPPDVTAFGNIWASPTTLNSIEDVVYHDSDVNTLGFVDFAAFGNLVVTPDTATTINEGGSVTISGSFSNVPQPHTVTIVWGDGSPNTVIPLLAGDFDFTAGHTYTDNTNGTASSVHPITVTVEDASMDTIGPSAAINVTVNNTAPVVALVGPTGSGSGEVKSYTFTTADLGDDNRTPGQLSLVSITAVTASGGATGVVSNIVYDSITGNGSFDVTYSSPPGGGSVLVTVTVQDDDGAVDSDALTVTVGNTLQVTSFTPTASGFDVTFNRAPNLGDLNLYDGVDAAIDLPDVILHANSAAVGVNVRGSLVWHASTNTLSFVATGGILANDTYSVTLVSGNTAFHDAFGKLDGDGDFNDTEIPDNYTNSFVVNVVAGTRVVSLRDFVRGPGQNVEDTPATPGVRQGVKVSISDASGMESIDFKFLYDPALLDITGAALAEGMPAGWAISFNDADSGILIVTAFRTSGPLLSGLNRPIIEIESVVPATAASRYGDSQTLILDELRVNEDNIASIADIAIHKNVYLADADGSSIYTGNDAGLIAGVVVSMTPDTAGFDAHDWTDPRIVGDATGDGTLSGLDASYVAQKSVGLPRPEIPNRPIGIVVTPVAGGIDPELSISDDLVISMCALTVPVNISIPSGDLVRGTTFDVTYSTSLMEFEGGFAGSFWTAGTWDFFANEVSPGVVRVTMFNLQGNASAATPIGTPQNIANLVFHVDESAAIGQYNIKAESIDPMDAGLTWTFDPGKITVTTSPAYLSGDANGDHTVNFADFQVMLANYGQSGLNIPGDVNCDGTVNFADFQVILANYGTTIMGSGSGSGSLAGETLFVAGGSSASSAPPAAAALQAVSAPVTAPVQTKVSMASVVPTLVEAAAVEQDGPVAAFETTPALSASHVAVSAPVSIASGSLFSTLVFATVADASSVESEVAPSVLSQSIDDSLALEAPSLQLAAIAVDYALDSFDSDRTCRFSNSDAGDEVLEDLFLEWADA